MLIQFVSVYRVARSGATESNPQQVSPSRQPGEPTSQWYLPGNFYYRLLLDQTRRS